MAVPASGHWWTIAPHLLARLRPAPSDDAPWSTILADPHPAGASVQRLVGAFGDPRSASGGPAGSAGDLFVLVHGLGGDADSPYMRETAAALREQGHATLRLSMRGAGHSDADFYHAGLVDDLVTVLADPSLAAYARVFVLGFSLGGHVSLHLTLLEHRDPRVAAVIAVCSPLDLERNVYEFDRGPSGWLYRRHILNGLAKLHTKVHPGTRRRFATIREWDEATIVPRWGFASAEQYWRSQSVGPRLRAAGIPVLYVGSEDDPMVPATTVRPHLERAGSRVDVRWVRRGGHVGFPREVDLGLPGELGLVAQILSWTAKL